MRAKVFPILDTDDLDRIAIHECRVFDRHGRLKRIFPAKTLRQVMKSPLGAGFPEGYFKVTHLPA